MSMSGRVPPRVFGTNGGGRSKMPPRRRVAEHGDGGRELPSEANRGMTFRCFCARAYLTRRARETHILLATP